MATVRKRTWQSKGITQTAWLVDYRDSAGKRRFQTFKLRKHADAALVEIQGELTRGTHTPSRDSLTVAEAAEVWYAACQAKGHEAATLRNYRGHLDRYIVPTLGRVKLAKLTTPGIAAYRDELLRNKTSQTTRKLLGCLKSILAEAQVRGLVAQNVALPIKVETKSRDRRRLHIGRDIPSKEEIRIILDTAKGIWRPLFVTAIFTGMRTSELRGLTWNDVDFTKKVVHVRQRADRFGTLGQPKSFAGQREIPMSPMVVNALREWRLACPKGSLNFVFPN